MQADAAPPSPIPHWSEVDWSEHTRDEVVFGRRMRFLDAGSGPAVLLIHGLGGCWQTWLENIPTLREQHRVIALDLPGFGLSEEIPPPAEMTEHVRMIFALLERLELDAVSVVGHSMGGLISMMLATSDPSRVNSLVLVSAGAAPIPPSRLKVIVRAFEGFRKVFALPGVSTVMTTNARVRHAMLRGFLVDPTSLSPELALHVIPAMNAPGFGSAVLAAARAVSDVRAAEVQCPTLAIWGDQDRILPLRTAEELVKLLPHATLAVLPSVGHCPMFEAVEDFNDLLLSFLGESPLPTKRLSRAYMNDRRAAVDRRSMPRLLRQRRQRRLLRRRATTNTRRGPNEDV